MSFWLTLLHHLNIRNAYNAKTALFLFVSHGFFLPESCLHCIALYIRHLPALCMCAWTAIWLTEHFQCHPPRLPPLSGGFLFSFFGNFRPQQLVHRALKCSRECRQHLDTGISRTGLPLSLGCRRFLLLWRQLPRQTQRGCAVS